MSIVLTIARKNAVPIFVVTGTLSIVLNKLMFTTSAEGIDGDMHLFGKPWFSNWIMFLAMSLCVLVFLGNRWWDERHGREVKPVTPKLYYAIAIPALCDMIGSYLMNVGLLWIPSSIWQMLRGAVIIFTALLKVFYRKKKLWGNELSGMLVVVVGIAIVGLAAFKTPGESQNGEDPTSSMSGDGTVEQETWKVAAGVLLVVGSCALAAMQTIVEEKLLHDVEAPATLVVGMEGVWGLLLCSLITMPIAQHLPGPEGLGLKEDTLDSFVMIYNSPKLLLLNLGSMVVILFFNLYGMIITETTDAMLRNIIDPLRTMFIWITMVFIHYVISHHYGEALNYWSFLELGGFAVLVFGFLVYNAVLRFPFLKYPPKEKSAASINSEKTPLVNDGSV